MASSSIKEYYVDTLCGFSFGVGVVDGKGGVGTRTTHLTSQDLIVGLMVAILYDLRVGCIHP